MQEWVVGVSAGLGTLLLVLCILTSCEFVCLFLFLFSLTVFVVKRSLISLSEIGSIMPYTTSLGFSVLLPVISMAGITGVS